MQKPRRPGGIPAEHDFIEFDVLYGMEWERHTAGDVTMPLHGEVRLHRFTFEMGMLPYRIRAAVEEGCRRHAERRLTPEHCVYITEGQDGVLQVRSVKEEEEVSGFGDIVREDVLKCLYFAALQRYMDDEDVPEEVEIAIARGEDPDPPATYQPGTFQHDAWCWYLAEHTYNADLEDLFAAFHQERTQFASDLLDSIGAPPPPAHAARRFVQHDPAALYQKRPVASIKMQA